MSVLKRLPVLFQTFQVFRRVRLDLGRSRSPIRDHGQVGELGSMMMQLVRTQPQQPGGDVVERVFANELGNGALDIQEFAERMGSTDSALAHGHALVRIPLEGFGDVIHGVGFHIIQGVRERDTIQDSLNGALSMNEKEIDSERGTWREFNTFTSVLKGCQALCFRIFFLPSERQHLVTRVTKQHGPFIVPGLEKL